ncbi:MAG TPA: PQQ-dependent sugar dehydrogenase [Phycisphaerae bacterium]|nr:PQQ-dependent sugar dehydrogenase [Phycisphaerae bacterium]
MSMTRFVPLRRDFIVQTLIPRTLFGLAFIFAVQPLPLAAQTLNSCVAIDTIIDSDLSMPTGMAFLGEGDFFVIEKVTGQVKRVTNGAVVATVLDLPVNGGSERGLLGITLHPNFANNNFVYLYYSRAEADNGAWLDNRVSRFTWNGTNLIDETLIVSFPMDPNQNNGSNHDGGIILFGPDGKLYGITGDLNRSRLEQNVTSTAVAGVGGVFRLNDDGTIPADNPFIDHAEPVIKHLYAYGVRNSFGMTFDPVTDNLWDTENGPNFYDEVNLVPEGFNSGWSKIMGPDARDSQDVDDLIHLTNSVYSDPKLSFLAPVAVTAILFIEDSLMPASWQGTLVLGDANNGNFYRFNLNEDRDALILPPGVSEDLVADTTTERNSLRLGNGFGPTTDLKIGPDGYLYQLSLGGDVRRIRPVDTTLGDMNCDTVINLSDVDPFVLALTNSTAYLSAFPGCLICNANFNDNDGPDGGDIAGFVALLLGP